MNRRKNKILFVGPVSRTGGPGIKNRLLCKYLKKHGELIVWNSFSGSLRARLGSIFSVLFTNASYVIVGVSYRGRSYLYPLLYLRHRLTGLHYTCVVIGGNVVERTKGSLGRKALKHADLVTVETEALQEEVSKSFGLSNVYYLPNYKELKKEKLVPMEEKHFEEKLHFVYLSQVRNNKGIKVLVEAFSKLVDKGHEAVLDIYGPLVEEDIDPDFLNSLEKLPAINYHGPVDNKEVIKRLHEGHVFVFPTLCEGEGFPAVILEAMAAGLPVISTGVKQICSILEEEKNGWLFPLGDVDCLCRRLEYCILQREKLMEVSKENFRKAASFDAETLIDAFAMKLRELDWPFE